ncbi:hypothetical protein Aple_090240 [Acrocarpospora pleiomorpha]|uniref:Protein kinase domain-containing protein n=1 Tax=Acrocarpospora pleiomorpha TaxID=90975 RepID=A0A5M3XYB8_9ACTN|nr:hypothetical protein [Acrocarpospora pleiomorpha]GES26125.1 hypothetical protein Aple_090240 [Acrocarpospora pleiomorpha]
MDKRIRGKSGRLWSVRSLLLRGGHIRPTVHDGRYDPSRRVDLVQDQNTYGALRRFADRRQRAAAISLISAGAPVTPVLVDVIDDPSLAPSIVTSWVAGGSDVLLDRLSEVDDLAYLMERGHKWTPAQALRTLVPLGQALDVMARQGFIPIELSPDHVIFNSGSIQLVGIGRHLYRPDLGDIPDVSGMSLLTTLLLGDDHPASGASSAVWRDAQLRALLRLAGWMVCGLPPTLWGHVASWTDLQHYLTYAGFTEVPRIRPGQLALHLAEAADRAEQQAAERQVKSAPAVVLYDDHQCSKGPETLYDWFSNHIGRAVLAVVTNVEESTVRARIETLGEATVIVTVPWQETYHAALRGSHGHVDLTHHYREGDRIAVAITRVLPSTTGGQRPRVYARLTQGTAPPMRTRRRSSVDLNAESVRLGLLHEHGPGVIAVAAFSTRRMGVGAALLSGAGWVLVDPSELPDVVARLVATNPAARYVIVGEASGKVATALRGVKPEVVLPHSAAPPPQIAGRPALALPYVMDSKLDDFGRRLPDRTGSSFRRRTFPAGWAHEWVSTDAEQITNASRSALAKKLKRHAALFADNTELLVRIGTFLRRPGHQSVDPHRLDVNLQQAATVLSSVPARGKFRRDLTSALLGTSYKDLYRIVTQRLLPVALQLADAYDPGLLLGGRGMDENLFDEPGVRRLALYGRLVTALPGQKHAALAEIVSALEDDLVTALADIPAPSLQYLVARLRSPELLETLRGLITGGDFDLLTRYTPTAWRLLLEELRQPELLGVLGLGWALVVERDQDLTVDGRMLIRLAGETGREPGHIVRALLDTPTESWRGVVDNPGLARNWLARYGDLDVAGVLRVFPDAELIVPRVGYDALRAAAAGGLDRGRLDQLLTFAAKAAISPAEAIEAFLSTGIDADRIDTIIGPAAVAWSAYRIQAGDTIDEVIRRLVTDPQVLRVWAIEGRNLSLKVLTDLLGTRPQDLGVDAREGRELLRYLEREPGVMDLCARVIFPRQRLRLLRLAAANPERRLVHPAVAAALPGILDEPDLDAALSQLLDEGLDYKQIVLARTLSLDRPRRELLRSLGPVALEMDAAELATLLTLARIEGAAFAVEAAQLECERAGTVQLLSRWGTRWLPVLAGRQGATVAVLLARHRPEGGEWISQWLLDAGVDGLAALARHGRGLLHLVAETRPPVADVRVLSELLDLGPSQAPRLYRLVVDYGLPRESWGQVYRWLEEGKPPDEVLLRLWDSAAARLLA